ncbi:hypothetical protein F383_38086 [Gossypium arboreum]|uniref:Uncharacterized protein n=1 Tax=Gossypium arboreum TaxID=29729 RepID=A0A0B0MHB1_GOSAR|nr:hypothetical protein F383_38086 [Gossypium arboreum]
MITVKQIEDFSMASLCL